MAAVRQASAALQQSRLEEARIAEILSRQLDAIAELVERADAHPGRSREAISARLAQQVQALRRGG